MFLLGIPTKTRKKKLFLAVIQIAGTYQKNVRNLSYKILILYNNEKKKNFTLRD